MITYKYYYKDNRTNRLLAGLIEGRDLKTVRSMLRNKGIKITKIHDAAKPPWEPFSRDSKGKLVFNPPPFMQSKVGHQDIVIFCKQFSVMIDAGLPLVEGLNILSEQGENLTFNYQLRQVAESIEAGNTLAASLEKFPNSFDRLFCNMIHAGEEGGILDSILKRLATFLDKSLKLKKQIKGAMIYPAGVIIVAVVVIGILLVFVVPVFEQMFSEMGGQLPALTQIIIDMSRFVIENIAIILVLIIGSFMGFVSFIKNPKGRQIFDRIILKSPVIGNVIRAVAIARFSGTMSTMLNAGVAIIESLEICSRTAGNYVIEKEILRMKDAVTEGESILSVTSASTIFPKLVSSMMGIGEESGNLDVMLEKISIYYEEVTDEAVKSMTSMIEPIMIVFLGGIVGTLVVAMYLPIFTMASNFA